MNRIKCINLLLKVKEVLIDDEGLKLADSEQVLDYNREIGYIDDVMNYLLDLGLKDVKNNNNN